MLITAHRHLDTHKQNQSDYRSKPKTFSYHKKQTNKYDCNMIKYTEHFPGNLQAAAYKNHSQYHKSPGRWTNNLTHAIVFFMSSEMYTSLSPSTLYLLLEANVQVLTLKKYHWKASSLPLILQPNELSFQSISHFLIILKFQHIHNAWKSQHHYPSTAHLFKLSSLQPDHLTWNLSCF